MGEQHKPRKFVRFNSAPEFFVNDVNDVTSYEPVGSEVITPDKVRQVLQHCHNYRRRASFTTERRETLWGKLDQFTFLLKFVTIYVCIIQHEVVSL